MMRYWLIATNILFTLIGVLSIALAIASPFLFDAPGSEKNTIVWVLFFTSISFPFACLASVLTSTIVGYKTKRYKLALSIALLPCILIAVLIASLIAIEVFCGGTFSCSSHF